MIRRPPRSTRKESSAASDVYKRQTQYTRYGTVLLAFIQASALAVTLSSGGLAYNPGTAFFVSAVFSVVAGTIFLMWLGEQISERGIGNGISIIIATSILTGIPSAIGQALEQARQGDLNILMLLSIGVLAMVVIAVVVFIERGQRRITVTVSYTHLTLPTTPYV